MTNRTITQAIVEVLKKENTSLSASEILTKIKGSNLYQFKSMNAGNIVRSQLRRHCKNIKLLNSSKHPLFIQTENGQFTLAPYSH